VQGSDAGTLWTVEPDVRVDVGGVHITIGDHAFPSVGRRFELELKGIFHPGDRVRFVLPSTEGRANCSDVAPGIAQATSTKDDLRYSSGSRSATFVFESPPGSPEVTPLFMCYATTASDFVPQDLGLPVNGPGQPALMLFADYPPTRAVLDAHYPRTPDTLSVRRVGSLPPQDWTIWKELAKQAQAEEHIHMQNQKDSDKEEL